MRFRNELMAEESIFKHYLHDKCKGDLTEKGMRIDFK